MNKKTETKVNPDEALLPHERILILARRASIANASINSMTAKATLAFARVIEADVRTSLVTQLADAPSEADQQIGLAHIIFDEAKIPPGLFRYRLVELSRKAAQAAVPRVTGAVYQIAISGGHLLRWYDVDPEEYANSTPELRRIVYVAAPAPEAGETAAQTAPMKRETGFGCPVCCAKPGDPHVEGYPCRTDPPIEQWSSGTPIPECPICHDTGIAFGKVCECRSDK